MTTVCYNSCVIKLQIVSNATVTSLGIVEKGILWSAAVIIFIVSMKEPVLYSFALSAYAYI